MIKPIEEKGELELKQVESSMSEEDESEAKSK